ncbi:MAG: hypothetical protein KKE94_11215 [Gammaproteobacteria bacterium]|nr:hypothetical protein [Gammaproteobacteria bacterium]
MSVLNKMLRDLEQREQATGSSARSTSISRDESRPLWLNILLLGAAALLVFAVYAILNRPEFTQSSLAASPKATAIQPLVQSQVVDETALTGEVDGAAPLRLIAPQAERLTPQPEADVINTAVPVEVAAEQVVAQQVIADKVVTEQVVAEHVVAPQPVAAAVAAVQADPLADVAADSAKVAKVAVVQRPVQSAEQKAQALGQQAVQAAQSGQLMPALSLWQQVQQLSPQQPAAYIAASQLWQQLGQPGRAQQQLQLALSNGADSAEVRLLLAQYYAAAQQWQQADELLPAHYALAQYPEYYGLKATVLQQLADNAAALNWFNQLIVQQPQQARWWLGAAIAYDQSGQAEQAVLHYRQALQWGDNLSADSRNYIQQRLATTE